MFRRIRNLLRPSYVNPLEARVNAEPRNPRAVNQEARVRDILQLTDPVQVLNLPLSAILNLLQVKGLVIVQAPEGTPETDPLFSCGSIHFYPLPGNCTMVGLYQQIKDIRRSPREIALAMKKGGVHPEWFPPGTQDV